MHETNYKSSATFICSFPDCQVSYNKAWKLEAHLCKHTGEVSQAQGQHVSEDSFKLNVSVLFAHEWHVLKAILNENKVIQMKWYIVLQTK